MERGEDGACTVSDGETAIVATLGMFIIDTFQFQDEATGKDLGDRGLGEQIGGGGTYFAVGARIWMAAEQILMTIDRGEDFSASVQDALDQYVPARSIETHDKHRLWRFRQRQGKTTKAVNIYRGQLRGFEYLTPKIRLDPIDLIDGERIPKLPTFIHCICSPERAKEITAQIECLRSDWPLHSVRPFLIWEPIPDSAVVGNLEATVEAACRMDVISPNHEEAANLLGRAASEANMATIQDVALALHRRFKTYSATSVPVLCVRSGPFGAFVVTAEGRTFWVEAYHKDEEKIVDVTGAGNAWLGGFVAGLARSKRDGTSWSTEDVRLSAQMGAISAAYTIEQRGLPTITYKRQGSDQLQERWNADLPLDRLRKLQDRSM